MTIEELRELAMRWRSKFSDGEEFERSWERLCDWAREHNKRLVDMDVDRWMFDDLQRDQEHAAGRIREPLVPKLSGASLVDCSHCFSLGFVRLERDPGQTGFGDAVRCPVCRGGQVRCSCAQCEWPALADHRGCLDESGHDMAHPGDCPRCLMAGVDQSAASSLLVQRADGTVDYVATLVARLKERRSREGKPVNAYERARAAGFTGSLEDWARVVDDTREKTWPS